MFTYDNTVPAANDDPSVDQTPMLQNAISIDSIIAVDHVGFNLLNGGYHTVIHQTPQLADPAAIAGPPQINQVYSKAYTPDSTGAVADSQLFTRTALGGISQLTGNSSLADGWQWLGGVLIQWGVVTQVFSSGGTSGTVTFKDRVAGAIPFPNNCFVVQTTPFITVSNPGSQASIAIRSNTLSKLKFDWRFQTGSTDYKGFYWIAIGN